MFKLLFYILQLRIHSQLSLDEERVLEGILHILENLVEADEANH
jgi:hypothetical protein